MKHFESIAAAVFVALIVLAGAYHGYAASVWHTARDRSVPVAERIPLARKAAALEPFNSKFAVTVKTVEAENLMQHHVYRFAWSLVDPISENAVVDPYFKQVYQELYVKKLAEDSRKAHQQHAREKQGGGLDPQDWLP